MFIKLLLIIVAVGAVACSLLVIRQQRIDTFHEITQTHQRLSAHERTLWEMRAHIAERCRPAEVRIAMSRLNFQWQPLPVRPGMFMNAPVDVRLARQSHRAGVSE